MSSLQTEMPASQADLDDPRYAKLRYHPGGLRAILTASTLKARVGYPFFVMSLVTDHSKGLLLQYPKLHQPLLSPWKQ